eukprot:CAMPEP_0117664014 /NCGR_PEP_ID=MMETSP0804-20121206/8956_1 /TAXON_ID=1074897 /ORGANISM="Tetraselmis astigmatica, Strain CCMP880" /LENGTH=122 /DNA_ID=CAMNT_0005471143 /DNA_START=241 /DNA_END=610 /DNA_ORIENTATION=-
MDALQDAVAEELDYVEGRAGGSKPGCGGPGQRRRRQRTLEAAPGGGSSNHLKQIRGLRTLGSHDQTVDEFARCLQLLLGPLGTSGLSVQRGPTLKPTITPKPKALSGMPGRPWKPTGSSKPV